MCCPAGCAPCVILAFDSAAPSAASPLWGFAALRPKRLRPSAFLPSLGQSHPRARRLSVRAQAGLGRSRGRSPARRARKVSHTAALVSLLPAADAAPDPIEARLSARTAPRCPGQEPRDPMRPVFQHSETRRRPAAPPVSPRCVRHPAGDHGGPETGEIFTSCDRPAALKHPPAKSIRPPRTSVS